ncbi:MAG TPA: DUF4287 domain-containing protein [Candidatus Krumholzibacteria bacterium]|nr:DUF4287 domain-containing protein [Candidatus Krumholzibacteria bacterium]
MPKQKDLKRLVRSRMKKTGESYTAARAHIAKKKTTTRAASSRAAAGAPVADYAAIAGMTDNAVAAKTGHTWKEWVAALDRAGAVTRTHTAIAKHLRDDHDLPAWWAQMVTVGYERIRGLRQRGQKRSGVWEVSKSRTFAVPVKELFAAWNTAKTRATWLPEKLTVRRATPHRSMRITWPDGTHVELSFLDKGGNSQVSVQHTRVTSKAQADNLKQFWAERLRALKTLLEE